MGIIEVNLRPETGDHVTSKLNADNTIRSNVVESILLRLDPDEKVDLNEQESMILNPTITSPETTIEVPTKNYVDETFNDIFKKQYKMPVYLMI